MGARCDERQSVGPATSLAARRAPFRTNASRHRFEKTIHNVKYRKARLNGLPPRVNHEDLVRFISGNRWLCEKLASLRQMRGGAYRDRTDDLMLAKQPLSQLS